VLLEEQLSQGGQSLLNEQNRSHSSYMPHDSPMLLMPALLYFCELYHMVNIFPSIDLVQLATKGLENHILV